MTDLEIIINYTVRQNGGKTVSNLGKLVDRGGLRCSTVEDNDGSNEGKLY